MKMHEIADDIYEELEAIAEATGTQEEMQFCLDKADDVVWSVLREVGVSMNCPYAICDALYWDVALVVGITRAECILVATLLEHIQKIGGPRLQLHIQEWPGEVYITYRSEKLSRQFRIIR